MVPQEPCTKAWVNPGKSLQLYVVDNCRYLHIRKSENPDFHQYPQIFGDISLKYEDRQRFVELCGY